MICVTGSEPTVDRLSERIRALPEAPLHEARLDLLEHITPGALWTLPERHRLIVTCRLAAEGGQWSGDESARRVLMAAALEAGARYVDLEADSPDETWRWLHDRFGDERLVASVHRFEVASCDDGRLAACQRRLTSRPAATLKLAVAIDDVADLGSLRRLLPGDGRPLVRIGMGLAGSPGRVRYDVLDSPWTYATAPGTPATAPGQVGWDELAAIAQRKARRLLVLLGGAQVARSPGPAVYNALAAAQGLPYYYLAAPTRDLARAVAVLDDFGLVGASVTMPHKAAAAALARRLEDNAARLGAVNTLKPDGAGGWSGHNTDGVGVLGALSPHLEPGSQVVVLGTGGAARAAVEGLTRAGHPVFVVGRRMDVASEMARELGGTPVAWRSLPSLDFAALVNATPVGQDGKSSPLEAPVDWRGRVVLDMVIHPRWTPLLCSVRDGGGVVVPGSDMWVHQGAAQWSLLTGQSVTPEALTGLLPAEDPEDADADVGAVP